MKIGVKIMPRQVILDTQGRAVEKTLQDHNYSISNVRVGKFVVLDIQKENLQEALSEAKKITEFVLYNPLIEDFSLEAIEK